VEQFAAHRVELAGGQKVTLKLSERGTRWSNQLWLREMRKLTESGHQAAMLTTNFSAPLPLLAASMFARWCQENFFRYMREQYGLDRLVEYGSELIADLTSVVNPQWRRLDSQIRSKTGQQQRLHLIDSRCFQVPMSHDVGHCGHGSTSLDDESRRSMSRAV